MTRYIRLVAVVLLVLLALPSRGSALQPAPVVKNPVALAFTCADHATDTGHEIAIVRVSDGVTIQTIAGGDPDLVNGEVVIKINVQPVTFGQYKFRARVLAGDLASEWAESEVWERAPATPTGLKVR